MYIKDARLYLPNETLTGDLVIKDGKITAILTSAISMTQMMRSLTHAAYPSSLALLIAIFTERMDMMRWMMIQKLFQKWLNIS
ncbi:hypothetical protein [Halolactibacillus sp. JCM 19043]|uniref:hypothetical protein n=1 Tax=Halolactibacillus sp. JCM 19043 TaxID=1460638 RepID=UPI003514E364